MKIEDSMNNYTYSIACDFGSSGGKIFLGTYDGTTLTLEEIHRFSLQPVEAGAYYYTDVLYMWGQLKESLKKIGERGIQPHSIGIDTWGVDYAYLNKDGELLNNPLNYRNERTLQTVKKLEAIKWSPDRLYKLTGNSVMPYNTLFQIYEDVLSRKEILKNADCMLFTPDLFNYWLNGEKKTEYTIASTAQMVNIQTKDWAKDMLQEIGFSSHILPEIAQCGTKGAMIHASIAAEAGLKPFPVVSTGSHDTASAVVASPLTDQHSFYLSSGTWSLIGAELSRPILTEDALKKGFTNEGGFGNTIRFLKGINGLWILQLLQRLWNIDFPELIAEARKAQGAPFIIDVTDDRFYNPKNIEKEIVSYCQEHGQGTPSTKGEILYAFYRGLSSVYGQSVRELEEIVGYKASALHIVGGGSRDTFLNELTAQETKCPVIAGPVQGSALGNVLIQMKALGVFKNIDEMRSAVRRSFPIEKF